MNPSGYSIRIQGQVSAAMLACFEGIRVEYTSDADTILYLSSADQAGLFGTLLRIRDLGIRLISVNPSEPAAPSAGGNA